ncbi:MAG: hypothetical protein LUD12_15900 [Lachnospiraceae bacterium]|nr:hypothetical protein [Lachnospiraceae bacterium]
MGRKNRNYTKKRNPILIMLYIVAVVFLVACIGYFYYLSKEQSNAYKERKAALQSEEEYEALTETPETDLKTLEGVLNEDYNADTSEEESESELIQTEKEEEESESSSNAEEQE